MVRHGPFVKRSISLSPAISKILEGFVRVTGQDRSAVIEAAIQQFSKLDAIQIVQAVWDAVEFKRSGTPSGWRSVFWGALVAEFNLPADVFAYASNQPYGPRTIGNIQVVFLLTSAHGDEAGPLVAHAFQYVSSDDHQGQAKTWQFALADSPIDAAQKVAHWIRAIQRSEAT